jgi:membrane-bound metal-dependent hydrolase YbcI (DUF457 family)
MGKSHLAMGACAVGAASAAQVIPWGTPKIGAAVASLILAGVVFPDIDHKSATATISWGLPTKFLCRIFRLISRIVYYLTRCEGDPRKRDPHRTFTHTWPGAVFQGVLVAVGMQSNQIACTVILGMLLGIAARAVDKNWIGFGAVAGSGIGWAVFPELVHAWWIMWVAMAVGCYLHVLTDCVTKAGAPLYFPAIKMKKGLKRNGEEKIIYRRRWHMSGPPEWMQFRTGGLVEKFVVGGSIVGSLMLSYWFVTAWA